MTVVDILIFAALIMIAIVAGLLPARRNGSMSSAALAGIIVALADIVAEVLLQRFINPDTFAVYLLSTIVLSTALEALPSFIISLLSGLVGRLAYRRVLVPTAAQVVR